MKNNVKPLCANRSPFGEPRLMHKTPRRLNGVLCLIFTKGMSVIMKKYRFAALCTALMLAIAGCSGGSGSSGTASQGSGSAAVSSSQAQGQAQLASSIEVASAEYDESSATKINFNGDSIEVSGSGATFSGSILTINSGGTYLLTGTLTDGQVIVDATKNDKVQLVLNGVNITSSQNAAIYCPQVNHLVITLADGTRNTVTDAADYTYADAVAEEPDAAIFAKDDLTLNGTGALTVNGNFNNGIGSKDNLVIGGGTYTVTAANHGIRGRDSLAIVDGDFTIHAGADGLQSNNGEDTGKGWIQLTGGSFDIMSGNDGIQAETALTITGGTYSILSGSGSAAASSSSSTDSFKGLKAGTDITLTGGSFTADCADDTIHANGDILISGGDFSLQSGDDGVHADGDLTISGGSIEILKSYEGLEATTMTIQDGVLRLAASDDGINVAGGNDGEEQFGRFGPDSFSDGSRWLHITGGSVTVDAAGDGLDANGDVEISGGTTVVYGPVSGGNGVLDYDGTFSITGGILAASGSSGMAQTPSASSTQPSLAVYFTSTQAAGTAYSLTDGDGNELYSFTPAKDYQFVIISTPEMKDGSTYTVNVGGVKVVEATLSGSVTSISDTGEAVTGGMGMGGGPGGGRGGRGGGGIPGQLPEGMPSGDRPERQAGGPGGDVQPAGSTAQS